MGLVRGVCRFVFFNEKSVSWGRAIKMPLIAAAQVRSLGNSGFNVLRMAMVRMMRMIILKRKVV